MHIAMFTNTYLPLVGGASISIDRFCTIFRALGHSTLIVAPAFEGAEKDEPGIVRVPALRNFSHTRFSVPLPLRLDLGQVLQDFEPCVVHAHHPFFLGDTAVWAAARFDAPLIATHHTHHEQYRTNIPDYAEWLCNYVDQIAVGHANLCDAIIAPSEGVKDELRDSGVEVRIDVIPTGVDLDRFDPGDGSAFRKQFDLPKSAPVLGHVGRLAPEKNLRFLAEAMARALSAHPKAYALIVGDGAERDAMETIFADAGCGDRAVFAGVQKDDALVAAYRAMDLFAFASKSETQGMVVAEAMACGVPVVALRARGITDVVRDGENGILAPVEDEDAFAKAIARALDDRTKLAEHARDSVRDLSMDRCAKDVLALYEELAGAEHKERDWHGSGWASAVRELEAEWEIWSNRAGAAAGTLLHSVEHALQREE